VTFTLSPYGEGYCPVCRFVEPLGPDGLIEPHTRFSYSFPGGREICAGSVRRPPKLTTSHTGVEYFANHRNRMLVLCRMVGLAYNPADNG
jgi:hypothetical protein